MKATQNASPLQTWPTFVESLEDCSRRRLYASASPKCSGLAAFVPALIRTPLRETGTTFLIGKRYPAS